MGNIVMRHPGSLMGLFDDFAFPRVWGRDFDTDLPRVDIVEEKERYRLVADLPGLSEKDVEVQVENGTLTISGKHEAEKDAKEDTYLLRERRAEEFRRSFQLSDKVDAAKIEAKFANGQLVVIAPKSAEKKPQQISVKAA